MDRIELLRFLRDKFNDQELRDLCFELAIDYESLGGEGKAAKARELVAHCERRERLKELEKVAQRMLDESAHHASTLRPSGPVFDQRGQHVDQQINVAGDYIDRSAHGDTYTVNVDHVENLAIGHGAQVKVERPERALPSKDERASLQHHLTEARANLKLIEERMSEYVLSTDVPLQLIKEQRALQARLAELEQKLGL